MRALAAYAGVPGACDWGAPSVIAVRKRDLRCYAPAACCPAARLKPDALLAQQYVCTACGADLRVTVRRATHGPIADALATAGAQRGSGWLAGAVEEGWALEAVVIERLNDDWSSGIIERYLAVRHFGAGRRNLEALQNYSAALAGAGIATKLMPRSERTWMLRVVFDTGVSR